MRPILFFVALPLVFAAGDVQPQGPHADGVAMAALADSLYFASRPDKALELCEREIAAGADGATLQWRAARAAIAMGMMIPESPRRKELYDIALAHARSGLALAPGDINARYWVAAAAGRRAHRDDPILSIRLAYEVYEQVTAILAVDSLHAGAHHALGALNAEVMRAPGFVRFIAGRILRMDLANRANWPDAEREMRRAVALDPSVMMYAVDLANLYGRAGRTAQLDSVLARLEKVPPRHPMDRIIRDACVARWRAAAQSQR
jgi:tetratricopeptide (TPR) repeat protein